MTRISFTFTAAFMIALGANLNACDQTKNEESADANGSVVIAKSDRSALAAPPKTPSVLGAAPPNDQSEAEVRGQLTKKAGTGDADAMLALGVMCHDGDGVSQDYAAAMGWFRKAAHAGDAKAMSYLGMMYYKGEGVAKSRLQALKWGRRAARLGDANAQNILNKLGISW